MKLRARMALVAWLAFTALLVLPADRVQAQVDPNWDHYKVYLAQPNYVHNVQVTLVDQFQVTTHLTQYLDWFANPVEKRHGTTTYPIHDPELHYSWWQLGPEVPLGVNIIANNQFGEQTLHLVKSVYLLNPALKNAASDIPLPVANHYKCYECTGNPVDVPVFLTDQFFARPATVLVPRYFCSPVDKHLPNGLIYPIVDVRRHYTVYDMDFTTQIFPASIRDQFFTASVPVELNIDRLLMVPTDKTEPTPAVPNTWGRLKSQYR